MGSNYINTACTGVCLATLSMRAQSNAGPKREREWKRERNGNGKSEMGGAACPLSHWLGLLVRVLRDQDVHNEPPYIPPERNVWSNVSVVTTFYSLQGHIVLSWL